MDTLNKVLEPVKNVWNWLGKAVVALEVSDEALVRVRVRTVAATAAVTAVVLWVW